MAIANEVSFSSCSTYTYGHWCHCQTVTPISTVLSLDIPTVIGVTVRLSHLFLLYFLQIQLRSIGVTVRLSHLFQVYFLYVYLRSLVSPSDCHTLICYTFVFLSFASSPLLLVYPRFSSRPPAPLLSLSNYPKQVRPFLRRPMLLFEFLPVFHSCMHPPVR